MTTLPTIHLNGTGADTLLNEYNAVVTAVRNAAVVLAHATCNERDFYIQGSEAWKRAQDERARMFALLGEVCGYAAAWEAAAYDAIEMKASKP